MQRKLQCVLCLAKYESVFSVNTVTSLTKSRHIKTTFIIGTPSLRKLVACYPDNIPVGYLLVVSWLTLYETATYGVQKIRCVHVLKSQALKNSHFIRF